MYPRMKVPACDFIGCEMPREFAEWYRTMWKLSTAVTYEALDRFAVRICNSEFNRLFRKDHETHLSTFCNQKKTDARLPGANENPRWAGGHQCSPRKGPCKARRLTRGKDSRQHSDLLGLGVLIRLFAQPAWLIGGSKYFSWRTGRRTPASASSWARGFFFALTSGTG